MNYRKICSKLHYLNLILKAVAILDNEISVRCLREMET